MKIFLAGLEMVLKYFWPLAYVGYPAYHLVTRQELSGSSRIITIFSM